jgi:hypothetical protein
MSLAASKYSVESWPVTSSIGEEENERSARQGNAVACEMHRSESRAANVTRVRD